MERRDFLNLGVQLLAGQALLTTGLAAFADERTGLPLSELQTRVGGEAVILFPSDAQFAAYNVSFNKRTTKMPQVRCLPKSVQGVSAAVKWARAYDIPFAVRGRGHSYEGYSQSNGLVIDLRLMNDVKFNSMNQRASVGGGAQLYDVYTELSKFGKTIPAGTCPPVGVGGHTLGGGFGLLGRKYGLACDSVVGFEMVDANGAVLTVTESENPDLFWALRGGGNGNFGIVTRFIFQTHPVGDVGVYGITWLVHPDDALKVAKAWQAWAPTAPDDIACIFELQKSGSLVRVHAAGQSVGLLADLENELKKLTSVVAPHAYSAKSMKYMDAVLRFGGTTAYESIYMKAKSDYLFQPMSDEGLKALIKSFMSETVVVGAIFDAYGGAVSRMKNDETAFVHREKTQYSIQYYTQWTTPDQTSSRMTAMSNIYKAMRPYVSGQCYVNYCDLELADGPTAYWASNLPRLKKIKAAVDPTNVFRHAQSL